MCSRMHRHHNYMRAAMAHAPGRHAHTPCVSTHASASQQYARCHGPCAQALCTCIHAQRTCRPRITHQRRGLVLARMRSHATGAGAGLTRLMRYVMSRGPRVSHAIETSVPNETDFRHPQRPRMTRSHDRAHVIPSDIIHMSACMAAPSHVLCAPLQPMAQSDPTPWRHDQRKPTAWQ